jgi:hypothetical protein
MRVNYAELSSPDTAGEVAQLYVLDKTHIEIRRSLKLTRAQLLHILTDLFAEGMPKRQGHAMTEAQVRDVHANISLARDQSTISQRRLGSPAIQPGDGCGE